MKRLTPAVLFSFAVVSTAFAQVAVKDPWVRATVPAQTATGAFMQIRATKDSRLIDVRSPVAGTVEIHEMTMANGVMSMRAIPGVDLPAGKSVDFSPGGYHIMLTNLKGQIKAGEIVPLTLIVESKGGKRESLGVKAIARALSTQ